MGNIIYENEDILVVTEDTNIISETENEIENEETTTLSGYDENVQFLSKHPIINIFIRPTDEAGSFEATNWFALLIIIPIIIIVFTRKAAKKRKAKRAAFEQKYAEKTAYDHYSSEDAGYSNSNTYDNYGYNNTNNSYENYSNNGYNSYNNNQSNGYNNYNNQSNNYNNTASSSQPINPFADEFEGKTPDAARQLYLKYMKAFHSDTGDGSDDEKVKLINVAYDEYKKKHGI